jgi:hypothetical protein
MKPNFIPVEAEELLRETASQNKETPQDVYDVEIGETYSEAKRGK